MKKNVTLSILALILAFFQLPATAQFKIPDFSDFSGDSANVPVTDFYAVFLTARLEMNQSQLYLAQAFDLKEQVGLLEAEQSRLAQGALTASDVKESVQLSKNASLAIDEKIDEGAELDEQGRQLFVQALPHLIAGTAITIELPNQAQNYVDQLKREVESASFVTKAKALLKVKDGIQIANQMPGYIKTTADNYRLVIGYGRSHSIPVPDDATDVLGSL